MVTKLAQLVWPMVGYVAARAGMFKSHRGGLRKQNWSCKFAGTVCNKTDTVCNRSDTVCNRTDTVCKTEQGRLWSRTGGGRVVCQIVTNFGAIGVLLGEFCGDSWAVCGGICWVIFGFAV